MDAIIEVTEDELRAALVCTERRAVWAGAIRPDDAIISLRDKLREALNGIEGQSPHRSV